jgi:hypothetical protein
MRSSDRCARAGRDLAVAFLDGFDFLARREYSRLVGRMAPAGTALADVGPLRAAPEVSGAVASDPTVSGLVDTLAADAPAAMST